MAKVHSIIRRLLVICVLLGLAAQPLNARAFDADDTSYQLTQPDTINTDWENYQDIPDSFELAAENTTFQLYMNATTLAFKVVDKRSGYVWHSNLDEKGEEDRLNRTWTAFAQSGISIDYLDQGAISERASITNSEVTIDARLIDQGFEAAVTFLVPSISLVLRVKLEPDGVSVEVPFDSIREESPDFKLGMLHVYPFFAATRGDSVPGYMFLPDGCGSLIRFSSTTKAVNMFYGKYYGADLGMIAEMPWDPHIRRPFRISIPVIGMVHGYMQNAYIAVVEKGASYGEIRAHPAGVITNFNFIYNTFVYNESYFQATNRSGAGVTTLQQQTNAFDVLIHYQFLTAEDSDYVGMARSYQQYLVDKAFLHPISTQNSDIGIRLEFLGGEKERILFWNRTIPMTTISQMSDILGELEVNNPDVIYYGWQRHGATNMPPRSFRLDRKLGNTDQLRDLAANIAADNGSLYLYLDPQAALYGERGYSTRHDLAMSITNINLLGFNRYVNYYFNVGALSDRYTSLSEDVFSELEAGLALDGIGSMLFSDFKRNNFVNREDTIDLYQSLLSDSAGRISLYSPNDYMFGLMQAYYDMPLTNSGYIYMTDVVPFLQIVLAGYVPYYGPALNFSSDINTDLLRQVDFGVYPSFFLTHEVTAKILNTASSWIYTSSIDQWGQEVERTYQWLNDLLKPVIGQTIVARQVLESGVVATTYSNHKQIIVNYNDTPYESGGLVVNGRDAVIWEVVP